MKRQQHEYSFSQRVWELATSIPAGYVTTYGDLAKAAGGTGMAARSITSILSKAPNQGAIPYHRIVYANGRVWFSSEDEQSRRTRYKREHIDVDARGMITNFEDVRYVFQSW